ncbi:type I-B CRISPR-associated protein Cas5b [Aneurinibacillus tyrosinisolvens]|uniref:type I-B CRISPR-associated protein Cas5b n=1 Tax=Aneurinibacillus tyrosinisolvens TaxID=1443435 RepID=UPI00063FBCD4|nr:type I-B CRISPR-associated protein Cas5b [Aneurinibacillus tyrosinisolvens]
MNVLRLKLYQETVCYTKPFANKVAETYPLPPYSTVKGFIHEVLQAKTLVPFSLSIQGTYESKIVDYRKTYMVKKKAVAMPIILDGLNTAVPYDNQVMTSMPLYTHMLYNVQLVVHIKAEASILQDIYEAFQTYDRCLSLGRHEDLVRVDHVEFVTLSQEEEVDLPCAAYIPKSCIAEAEHISGIPYQLNWTYTIKNGIREWEKVPVLYVTENTGLDSEQFSEPIYVDKTDQDKSVPGKIYPVFWNT